MTRTLVFRPEAVDEISEAAEWYEARNPGLGADFLRAVDSVMARIDRMPEAHPQMFPDARRAFLRRFPYCLVFKVTSDSTIIIGCFHIGRDAAPLQRRQ